MSNQALWLFQPQSKLIPLAQVSLSRLDKRFVDLKRDLIPQHVISGARELMGHCLDGHHPMGSRFLVLIDPLNGGNTARRNSPLRPTPTPHSCCHSSYSLGLCVFHYNSHRFHATLGYLCPSLFEAQSQELSPHSTGTQGWTRVWPTRRSFNLGQLWKPAIRMSQGKH